MKLFQLGPTTFLGWRRFHFFEGLSGNIFLPAMMSAFILLYYYYLVANCSLWTLSGIRE